MATLSLPIGKGYTAAQWEAWLTANARSPATFTATGTYQGTQLKGKTWAQVYQVIYAYGLTQGVTSPDDAAAATEEYMALNAIGGGAADLAQGAANATSDAAAGTAQGAASLIPSWADPLTGLLGDLTSKNTWLRVTKVVTGSVMVIIGLLNITGAGGQGSRHRGQGSTAMSGIIGELVEAAPRKPPRRSSARPRPSCASEARREDRGRSPPQQRDANSLADEPARRSRTPWSRASRSRSTPSCRTSASPGRSR